MTRTLERVVLGVAIAVRLAALWTETPWAAHPMVDAYTYWQQAADLLAGKAPFADGLYQPPGYPVFLWLLARLTGGQSLQVLYVAQQALGVLSTWLLIRLGRRLGEPAGAPWAGAATGLLFSLYPTTLLFELDVLTPALTSALLLGALTLAQRPSPVRGALTGLLLGLAAVVHPTYLLAAIVFLGWMAWRREGRTALAMAFALGLSLLPTTVVNAQRSHYGALVSQNAGLNFYLGNNPAWRDTSFLRPGLPFRKLVLQAEPHRHDVSERNRYWRRRAWSEISDAPDAWGAALLTKAFWSVHDTEIPRNEDYRCLTRAGGPLRWMVWLPVHWGWVFPFAVLGALSAWRRRERLLLPLWLSLQFPMILFLVADRYRMATWPVVVLLAPLGLRELLSWRPRPTWILAGVAAVIPWMPIDRRTQLHPALCDYLDANVAWMEGHKGEAAGLYQAVIEAEPDNIGAHYWLAHLADQAHRPAPAISEMEKVVADFPDYFPALKFLGQRTQKAGDLDAAIEWYRRAYAVPGDRTHTGGLLVSALVEAGRRDEAIALVRSDPKLARSKKVRALLDGSAP